jgi:hypothetical protein
MRFVGESHVKRRTIAVGVHGNGPEPQLAARANHPHGDLATIGDENFHAQLNRITTDCLPGRFMVGAILVVS